MAEVKADVDRQAAEIARREAAAGATADPWPADWRPQATVPERRDDPPSAWVWLVRRSWPSKS